MGVLGPRGPLVLPLVELYVRPQEKSGSQYIQAYMPYESSKVSSNQTDGVRKSPVLCPVKDQLADLSRPICPCFEKVPPLPSDSG